MNELEEGKGSTRMLLCLYILNGNTWGGGKRRGREAGLFRHSKMGLLFPLLSLQPGLKVFFRNMLPCR